MSKFLFLLALGSTVATYIPGFISGFSIPRWMPLVFFIAAWFMGSYDLYRTQEREIARLRGENEALHAESKGARLVLEIHEGSCFFRHAPDGKIAVGTYLHINTSVENKGGRASVVSKYLMRIEETGTDATLRPRGFPSIQGLSCQWAIETSRKNLAIDGYIRVSPDNLAGPDILPFYIDAVPPLDCHLLHCILTLVGTNGEEAEARFELREYGSS